MMLVSQKWAAYLAAIVLFGTFAGVGHAQTAEDPNLTLRGTVPAGQVQAKAAKKPLHKSKMAPAKTAQQKPAAKPELAPWAAVDPTRAGEKEEGNANAAPMPGVHHDVASGEGNTTLGVKWNANNDPNFGPMSTTGLTNSYNNAINGTPGAGATVEPGVKFKF